MELRCETVTRVTIMNISERMITILHGHRGGTLDMIAKFAVEDVWDALEDELAARPPTPSTNQGLHRRRGEALAAKLYTATLYR